MGQAFDHAREQQLGLTQTFEAACAALNIGTGSLDVWKRERLAHILEVLALTDEYQDWPSLTQKAVTAFLLETSEAAGPSEPSAGDS